MNWSYYILNASFKVTLDSDSFANADLQFSIAFFSNWRAGGGGGGGIRTRDGVVVRALAPTNVAWI